MMRFAMMTAQLAKSYAPAPAESEVRGRWEAADAFHAEPSDTGDPFCILIPPPNVTAALHLGHAFNNTLQDVLIRYHRMRGFNTLWMPGTDHAGIATQTVVEKRLLQEGTRRTELGRDEFVARVQAWKDEYEATIIEQLKLMGCSCDWARVRFTMDPVCVRAVRVAFFRLFAEGLIYRGKRLVNWDPVTLTALADDEVEMQELDDHMWYLRYPLVPASAAAGTIDHVTVATTRPETMLGDTAVAVNPRDPRAARLAGRSVKLPIVNRVVPIVADDYVVLPLELGGDPADSKSQVATGFLTVTPAHDPNDWEIGVRHDLAVINVMAPDATISADHGWRDVEEPSDEASGLLGLSRESARTRVVEWFEANGLLDEIRPYRHSVGHSYRSHVPIEPYLSDQWYVRVTDPRMRDEALRAMADDQRDGEPPARDSGEPRRGDGELRFFPERYAGTFQSWHENLRDWCISRQLWWGHRIPVWTLAASQDGPGLDLDRWSTFARAHEGQIAAALPQRPDDSIRFCVAPGHEALERELEAAGFEQDPDVLDTWFSSGLWPISTMGWPHPEDFPQTVGLLETFNPSSVLVTARDIITLWVSRMVMFNRFFRDGALPFRHVYINSLIQDGDGQRMSKSLGNGVDPRDIIHSHGADALRFVLVQIATSTQDVRLPVELVCPHCGETFDPQHTKSPAGYRVAAPEQTCHKCGKRMASAYGAAAGIAASDLPIARNSSMKFDLGRNFANKLWNAARFALGNLAEEASGEGELTLVDRWMVTRLHRTLHVIEEAMESYQFHLYAEAMYDLVWRDFCDWYLESIKPTVQSSRSQQQVLRTVLNALLRLLHPICPFVTEALWPHVRATGEPGLDGVELGPPAHPEVLATAPWPDVACRVDDDEAATTVSRLQELTVAIRYLRSEHKVPPRKRISLYATPAILSLIETADGLVETLAGLETVAALDSAKTAGRGPADGSIALTFEGEQLLVGGLAEAVDAEAERGRLTRLRAEKEKAVAQFRGRLANESYVSKAPAHLVEETRSQLAEAEAGLAAAVRALEHLNKE